MNKLRARSLTTVIAFACGWLSFLVPAAVAQSPEVQQRMAELKQAAAMNKQALARYTWQEQQTVSVKGEVKKQELFQVRMGPDGKPQKTPLGPPPQGPQPQQSGRRGGRLKQKAVEKKTEEFKDYAAQIGALAQMYAHPDPQQLQQALQAGNVTLQPIAGLDQAQLLIHNYVKPGDSMKITFNKAQKGIQSIAVSSYLEDPKDAVTLSADFARLPDGTNHVSNMLVTGVSKKLTVAIRNANYQKM